MKRKVKRFTDEQAITLQDSLAIMRNNRGHYSSDAVAIDSHRIISTTSRTMQMKKKQPNKLARKALQSFFANDSITSQPLACGIGSPGKNIFLLLLSSILKYNTLIINSVLSLLLNKNQ